MNWRKYLANANAGFWLFISLAFFGSMIWAKSRDPFERIWFTVQTPQSGKVKGVAVLPKRAAEKAASTGRRYNLPVVFYIYGSGGSLIDSGNELRHLAELGLAAVTIEYNQTNEAAFPEQFTALQEYIVKQPWAKKESTAWVGSSLGAQRTLSYLLNTPKVVPQFYVRVAGGMVPDVTSSGNNAAKLSSQSAALLRDTATKVLLIHGEHDDFFPAAEAKQVAELFRTNGVATELKILPGKRHWFDSDRAVVIRHVGEYMKAQLTPDNPLPEFPVTKDYWFIICIAPAFAWIGFWFYLRRMNVQPPTSNVQHSKMQKWEIAFRVTAVILATLALVQTAIHLVTPRMQIREKTLKVARNFLIPPKWKDDFETLAARNYWRGQKLKTLLTHVELSNYCVYELINWKLSKLVYDQYVLSPLIDSESDPELDWRRPLWEFFYPRIRKENDMQSAAEIVVRSLRERVTIDPRFSHSTGIESIWRNQIATPAGFERIYVATLRSVGVPARLDENNKAQFWTGKDWKPAPRPLIETWLN